MKRRCPCDVAMEVGINGFGLSLFTADCYTLGGNDALTCPCCACPCCEALVRARRVVGSFLCELARLGPSEFATCRNLMHASG